MLSDFHKRVPYGNTADYWSIGVMVFEFCFGKLPFEPFNRAMLKSDNQTAIREIRRRLMSPDIPRHAPQDNSLHAKQEMSSLHRIP